MLCASMGCLMTSSPILVPHLFPIFGNVSSIFSAPPPSYRRHSIHKLTEHVNQVLEQYLWCVVSYQQDDWTTLLLLVELVYNNALNSSVDTSPFFSNICFQPPFSISISIRFGEPLGWRAGTSSKRNPPRSNSWVHCCSRPTKGNGQPSIDLGAQLSSRWHGFATTAQYYDHSSMC